MHRRRFLAVTASTTALGLAGCTQESGDRGGNAGTETGPGDGGPGSQPEGTDSGTETDTPETKTSGGEGDGAGGASEQAWGGGGRRDGVTYGFSSRSPAVGENRDVAEVTFDTDAGEVLVDGTVSGNNSCRRAALGSLEYDESAGELTVSVETTDIEGCEAGAQALVGIDYDGRFEVDGELPSEVTVSHDGQVVAGAAHESSSVSATVQPTTTTE
ncbi:hypothetical protein [Halorientalis sp.]|jgi:hypothetical protein|uniref:hypothetical protein n=1 Tax=Halorientalis sp. TaxID=1931229 RepID=UPI0026329B1E|nr:hypothetical protein [Halorientalis sp.]